MKKLVLIFFLLIISLVGAYTLYEKKTAAPSEQKRLIVEQKEGDSTVCPAIAATGRYVDYEEEIVEKKCSGYGQTILFFYAPWCPECRGFDKAIRASGVPDGVQILKVDYDSSTKLKKKYGVTIQTTFVKVDTEGNKVALWTGYGKDKSVDAILENTQ